MKKSTLGALLALLFLLLLLVNAPAHLLGRMLPEESLRLAGFSGTVWNGEASNAAVRTEGGWLQLGKTRWSLSPLSLLLLSPQLALESRWGQQRLSGKLRVFPSGKLRVSDLDASFSAALLRRWMPVNLRGELNLLLERLDVTERMPSGGAGRLVWQQAFWSGNRGSQPLGDYVLEFTIPGPGQGQATVTTLSGPIRVEGGLSVDGRKYSVDARLTSTGQIDEELANALELMAAPVDGGFHLKFNSEF